MTTPPSPDRAAPVLTKVLAAEHAVVYGYGVAGAHLEGADRERAERGYDRHRAARDDLARRLTRRGTDVPAPAAAYALPEPVDDPRSARELVTLLEERLADVWADAVLDLRGALQAYAVEGLRDASVAAALWRRGSIPFPGLPERGS